MVAVGSSTDDLADPELVTCSAPVVFNAVASMKNLEDVVIDRL